MGVVARVFPNDRDPSRDELIAAARDAGAIVPLLSVAIDGELLAALPQVEVIANYAVGFDNVDLAACAARGVWVTNTPDVLTAATADLTWTLLLALTRRVREGERLVRGGDFVGWSPTLLLGSELGGKTLGIFGHGRIGAAVAKRALAFGMKVIHCSRTGGVSFEQLVADSDFISIHAPLNAATRHRFDASVLARMRRGAILINTARGPIVDEGALVDALAAGHLGGAGLDVFEAEPKVHPGLLDRDDVVLLPHLGSATVEARRAMARIALENAAAVLCGDDPPNPVQPRRGS